MSALEFGLHHAPLGREWSQFTEALDRSIPAARQMAIFIVWSLFAGTFAVWRNLSTTLRHLPT